MFPAPFRQTTAKSRILVADADAASRTLYRDSLLRAGWEVIEAEDGREALVKALTRNPTLIVTDLRLPLIDGLTLCDIIRRDRTTAGVPILIITTETQPAQNARAQEAGADDVMVKSGAAGDLVEQVRRLIARRVAPFGRRTSFLPQSDERQTTWTPSRRPFATTTPPSAPPTLACPLCGSPLTYEETHIGGVSRHAERWDYFLCSTCGRFQYRHRTRKLRQA